MAGRFFKKLFENRSKSEEKRNLYQTFSQEEGYEDFTIRPMRERNKTESEYINVSDMSDYCGKSEECEKNKEKESNIAYQNYSRSEKNKEKLECDDYKEGEDEEDVGYEDEEGEELKVDVNDSCPMVGQKFGTLDAAEEFYRDYGRKIGFEIVIRNSRRSVKTNEIISRMYICRKGVKCVESSRDNIDDGDDGKGKRRRETIGRTGCEARMYVVYRLKLNVWEVTTVVLEHNHEFVSPSKVQFMRRPRNVEHIMQCIIETLNKSSIGPSEVLKVMSEMGGGLENVGLNNQDVRNIIKAIRHRVFDSSDAERGLALLRELRVNSFGNFFFAVDVDDEKRVKSLLWVDSRCLHAYKNFGDVVSFDSTYRTNRYNMPFIPITGVNHHYQSILFGFALVRDEKEESFIWVLKNWLAAVGNKPPMSIITDQDIAMGNAIASVLPHTKHTYCTWHISNKFPEKLSALYTTYPDEFKKDFNSCVYKSLFSEEFESRWESLVEKYGLEDHMWLQEMYLIRHKWIRAYTRLNFAAGMTTTSRSESMNAFFDEYVNSTTGLCEFIENSQKALEKQYLREKEADYETIYKQRSLLMFSSFEYHAANLYRKEMFRRFQHELKQSGPFVVHEVKEHSSSESGFVYIAYKTTVPPQQRRQFTLNVTPGGNIFCVCLKFEHSGMMCRHIIRLLNNMQVTEIPTQFVNVRWAIDGNKVAGKLHIRPTVIADFEKSAPARYTALCKSFQALAASGSCSIPRYRYVMDLIDKQREYVDHFPEEEDVPPFHAYAGAGSGGDACAGSGGANDRGECEYPILDPLISQTKGRKKGVRIKSGIEVGKVHGLKERKCGFCKEVGGDHDARNCPVKANLK